MSIFGLKKPSLCISPVSITSVSTVAGEQTITTATAHGLSYGDTVVIFGCNNTALNGVHTVSATPPDTTHFNVIAGSVGSYTSGGYAGEGIGLNNCLIEYDFVQPDQINQKSIITGKRTNIHKGDYGEFKVTELLWKNGSASTKLSDLYAYYHTDVYFIPHRDGDCLKDSSGNLITCYMSGFKPFYYKNLINYDAVLMTFTTNDYHDVTKLL